MHRTRRLTQTATVGVAMLVAASACSSGSSGGQSSGAPSTGSSSASTGSSSSAAGLAAAQQFVDQYSTTPTTLPISMQLKSLPKGKTLYSLDNSSPVSIETAKAITAAGEALGMKVVTVNQGATPAATQAAWNSVVASHPDAVIGSGISAVQFKSQLSQLHARHVPVVLEAVDQPAGFEGVYATTLRPDLLYLHGRMQAAYAAVHSNGKGDILYVTVPAFAVLLDELRGFKDEMKQVCPTCKYDVREFTVDQIGTGIPGQIVSYVQSHPSTKYVVAGFTDMFLGVPRALQNAGFGKVRGIGEAATPQTYNLLTSGFEEIDAAVPIDYKGWYMATLIAYALAGQTVTTPVPDYPTRLLDAATVKALPTGTSWPGVQDYQSQFKKLWGL
jgi:ribose transport system substrate-binding protein